MKQVSEKLIQKVWQTSNVNDKRDMIVDIVNKFDHKDKQEMWLSKLSKTSNSNRLDEMATNLLLYGEGLKTV